MTHKEIVEKVKAILNEHGEVDAVSIKADRVLLKDYINSAIPDAVVVLAQKGYRVNVRDIGGNDGRGWIIPKDFLSLIYLKGGGWNVAVNRFCLIGSPEYYMAKNPHTPPGVNSPVCIRQNDVVELYPASNNFSGEYNAVYDNLVGADSYELKADAKVATAVCYMTAALVMGVFGDDLSKQRLSDISINMLQ